MYFGFAALWKSRFSRTVRMCYQSGLMMIRSCVAFAVTFCALACGCTSRAPAAPSEPWSVRMADSVMVRFADPATIETSDDGSTPKWNYAPAFLVHAVAQVGVRTGEHKYVDYARRYMTGFVDHRGVIVTPTYDPATFKLDDVAPARVSLLLHRQTRDAKWLAAAHALADQLRRQPRTSDGGFWHKQIYPQQMWLDGIFMACPFMAEYSAIDGTPWQDEAVRQIVTIAQHAHDAKTGLYYHGWDESHAQRWADPSTGRSPCLWARAVGWYAMGIVDTLESLPPEHPRRAELVDILRGLADAIARVQDPQTGLWFQILDQGGREGNYLESSASCMFVYALAKGVRLGHIEPRYSDVARRGYNGILARFVETDAHTGLVSLKDTCRVAGLGGQPYRDGSYAYYVSEPRVANDPKGLAPFILASLEIEQMKSSARGDEIKSAQSSAPAPSPSRQIRTP